MVTRSLTLGTVSFISLLSRYEEIKHMNIMGFETSSGDNIEVSDELFFAHCNVNGWRRFTDENGRVYTPEELSEKFANAPVPTLRRYNRVWWYEAM